MSSIRTAIFPVAGLGTRFLPITKAIPKEMLPIIDKPLIQFAIEEAIAAGIEHIIFVTSHGKRAIEDYFDTNFELEARLKAQGKEDSLAQLKALLPDNISFSYVRQKAPKGLGDAILTAKNMVGNEAFAILLADDLMHSHKQPVLQQMVQQYQQHGQSIVAVETIKPEETHKYGIVAFDEHHQLNNIVEKPKPENAPSNYAVVGRYILTPDIFNELETINTGIGGELQLTDAIAQQLHKQPVYAYPFIGKRYDCGSKMGYLAAVIDYAKTQAQYRSLFSTN